MMQSQGSHQQQGPGQTWLSCSSLPVPGKEQEGTVMPPERQGHKTQF